MLRLNKYLRELGFNEDYFLWNKDDREANDKAYVPDEDGFVAAEFYSLDASLSMLIYSYLCYFRDHCLNGYPSCLEEYGDKAYDKWCEIIDKMIEGFKLKLEDVDAFDKNVSKNRKKKINYAMRLFMKYYDCLWY